MMLMMPPCLSSLMSRGTTFLGSETAILCGAISWGASAPSLRRCRM